MTTPKTGVGIYSLGEAARIIRGRPDSIRRWLFGYDYSHRRNDEKLKYHSDPLWKSQYSEEEFGEKVIGFRDLLELRIVKEFVDRGVPLLVVRNCLFNAKEQFHTDYPATTQRFLTDGKTIFHEVVHEGGDSELVNLRSKNFVFKDIIKPSLYAGIEYSGKYARRWYPEGPTRKAVVIDPELQFGKPVIEESGVPTAAIYAAYLAENKDKKAVARAFEVSSRQVDAAVRFEAQLAA